MPAPGSSLSKDAAYDTLMRCWPGQSCSSFNRSPYQKQSEPNEKRPRLALTTGLTQMLSPQGLSQSLTTAGGGGPAPSEPSDFGHSGGHPPSGTARPLLPI